MGLLTYDVAVSLDGFIAGPDDDVSAFPVEGDHVDRYFERMATYQAVLMGRKTYEFGYRHGVEPGQAPYPGMDHYIISPSIDLPDDAAVQAVRADVTERVAALKEDYESLYLCGGGILAARLLAAGLLDKLVLKLAPVALGQGTRLFEGLSGASPMRLTEAVEHTSGVCTMY